MIKGRHAPSTSPGVACHGPKHGTSPCVGMKNARALTRALTPPPQHCARLAQALGAPPLTPPPYPTLCALCVHPSVIISKQPVGCHAPLEQWPSPACHQDKQRSTAHTHCRQPSSSPSPLPPPPPRSPLPLPALDRRPRSPSPSPLHLPALDRRPRSPLPPPPTCP